MTVKRVVPGPAKLCQRGGPMERWQTVSQGKRRGTFRQSSIRAAKRCQHVALGYLATSIPVAAHGEGTLLFESATVIRSRAVR